MEKANVSTKEPGKVMIIDDVEVNRFVLRNIIMSMGYTPILASDGLEGLELLKENLPSLILLDVAMPQMDGYEFASIVKSDVNTRDIPIIFISAFDESDDIVKGFKIGGDDYVTKPFVPEIVKARVGVHIKFYEAKKDLQDTNRQLKASLSNQLKQIEQEKKGVLYALAGLSRKNSFYDMDYFDRLQYNCRLLAQALQIAEVYADEITDTFIDTIEVAAPLCDIGNVAIPTTILQKVNEPLTEYEHSVVKTHAEVGSRILKDVSMASDYNDFVKMAVDIAHYHHENWDGSGYPEGIAGNEIPLSAQIVSLASVYCALTSDRSYRPAFSREKALSIIEDADGVKFNPQICKICKMISKQFK